MDESVVAFCAKDGIALIRKVLKGNEKVSAFNAAGDDPLITKKIVSKILIDNIRKCEVEPFGESSIFVVFASKDERKAIKSLISKTTEKFNRHYNQTIPAESLCQEIANILNQMSHHGSEIETQALFVTWSSLYGPEIYAINTDKTSYKYSSYAIGGGQKCLNKHLSCIPSKNMTTVECFTEGMKMLMEESEEDFGYELIRIGVDSQGKCEKCCDELCNEVLLKALQK